MDSTTSKEEISAKVCVLVVALFLSHLLQVTIYKKAKVDADAKKVSLSVLFFHSFLNLLFQYLRRTRSGLRRVVPRQAKVVAVKARKIKKVAVKLGMEGLLRVADAQLQPVVAVVPVLATHRREEYSLDYERVRLGVSGERLVMDTDMSMDEWADMADMRSQEGYRVEGLLYPDYGTDSLTVAVQGHGVLVGSGIVPQRFSLLLKMAPPKGSDLSPRLACPCGWSTEAKM